MNEVELIICKTPGCEEDVDPRRAVLGFKTCIYCGTKIKPVRTIGVPYNKGAYQLVLEGDIKEMGRK